MVVGFGEVWEEAEEERKRWRRNPSCLGRFVAARAPYKRSYERKRSYGTPSCALVPKLNLCVPHKSAHMSVTVVWEAVVSSVSSVVVLHMSYEHPYERLHSFGKPS